ncbi:hypothetical protein FN846DRAFT_1001719, partial [Sphaerosporella brunnea]
PASSPERGSGVILNPAQLATSLACPVTLDLTVAGNAIARQHGIGRIDIVENRFIGLKSRGCYETHGLSILRAAHIDLEGLVLDREVRALREHTI